MMIWALSFGPVGLIPVKSKMKGIDSLDYTKHKNNTLIHLKSLKSIRLFQFLIS